MVNDMAIPVNIENLIDENVVENVRIEYKSNFNPESVMKSICAFANDIDGYQGGYILIGIDTKNGLPIKPIKGLNVKEIDKIQLDILEYCKKTITPNYVPVIETTKYKNANIIVLWIYPGDERPYYILDDVYNRKSKSKSCYVRKGSASVKATANEIKELIQISEYTGFDDRLNRRASVSDIKPTIVKEFLDEIKSDLSNEFGNNNLLNIYHALHLVDGPKEFMYPKNIGLLFFNDNPADFIPNTYIEVDYIPNPTGEGMISKIFKGPIQRQLRDVLQYIRNNYIEEKIIKIPNVAESEKYYNYPYDAIEELIPNAVLHKDYQIPEPITIRITKEKIEVTSFPGFDRSITDQNIKQNIYISRRYKNKRIAEFLRDLNLIEAKNTGIPKAIRAMEKNSSPKLLFETNIERDYLTVIIPINKMWSENYKKMEMVSNDDLKTKIQKILTIEPLTLTELSRKLNYKTIPNSLRQAIKILVEEGKVFKINKKYSLNKE